VKPWRYIVGIKDGMKNVYKYRGILAMGLLAFACRVTAAQGAEAAPFEAEPSGDALQQTYEHEAMATKFVFTLYARPGDTNTDALNRIAAEAFQAVDDLESRVSTWIPDSQMSYVNNHAADEPVKIAPDLLQMLQYAKGVNRESGGAFDVTVGPLIELWGFYKGQGYLPKPEELKQALGKVGMQHVTLDPERSTVRFEKRGIRMDFGGIAKGMALDVAADVLRRNGVVAGILHCGTSTVYALGAPPGASGWTVRIRNPYNEKLWVDEVTLRDSALSTSGSYEKFFELEGKKYCHIFDPRTGMPVEGMLSATSVAPSGMASDALSTTFFVLGVEKTEAYCREHPEVRAILVPEPEQGGAPKPVRVNFPAGKE
jgi:thiamine biosynthesis lipoprotein